MCHLGTVFTTCLFVAFYYGTFYEYYKAETALAIVEAVDKVVSDWAEWCENNKLKNAVMSHLHSHISFTSLAPTKNSPTSLYKICQNRNWRVILQ